MKPLNNQKGIAMIMVLILSAIVLSFTAGVLYLITQGTILSGVEKRYATALEAGFGGSEVMQQLIDSRGVLTITDYGIDLDTATDPCLEEKMNLHTEDWTACNPDRVTKDANESPDFSLTLGEYTVNAKIIDTSRGNSNTSGTALGGTGVVTSTGGLITPPPIPYIYTIDVRTQRTTEPAERAEITAVYAY